jgi:hypothetical protein
VFEERGAAGEVTPLKSERSNVSDRELQADTGFASMAKLRPTDTSMPSFNASSTWPAIPVRTKPSTIFGRATGAVFVAQAACGTATGLRSANCPFQ